MPYLRDLSRESFSKLKSGDLAEVIVNIGSVAAWTHFTASTIRSLLLIGTGARSTRYVFLLPITQMCLEGVAEDFMLDRTANENSIAFVVLPTLAVSIMVAAGRTEGII